MLPYGHQSIDDEDLEAVRRVLVGDWLTTGPAVAEFEEALITRTGAADAVTVTSGTAALHCAYAGLGLGPGDEVITTPLTFVATASSAAILGARITFADVSRDTGNIDPACVEALISERTRVVSGVDYAGHPIDAPALRQLTQRHGIPLLEDAAHSIGGSLSGVPVGSLSDITTLSFFPTKNMTTTEGGAVLGLDLGFVESVRTFHNIGLVREHRKLRHSDIGPWHQEVHEFGLNYRLNDVACALGLSQLRRLDAFVARRAEIKATYDAAFSSVPELTIPAERPGARPAWHLYPLRVPADSRRRLFEHMRARGVGVQVNYIPVYWHPVFEDLGYARGQCPVAEEYCAQEISLPMFPDLLDSEQEHVIDLVRAFFGAGAHA